MAPMPDQRKKYAVYCAVAFVASAAIGTLCFFTSGRSDAEDAPARFAAKFQPVPMLRTKASARHPGLSQQKLLGDSSMKNLALTAMSGRTSDVRSQVKMMAVADRAKLGKMGGTVLEKAKDMAGVTAPLGFFDPVGFCSNEDTDEGKLCFYREVELKHGRVGMLASLGFLVGEQFHPLFGGDIDVPSYVAFQQTPLETFWPAVVAAIAIPEVSSFSGYESPSDGKLWSMKTDREAGDIGFDPLGLKPEDPEELKEIQNKELNNGRLAMIGAAGMIAQELVSGEKLFN